MNASDTLFHSEPHQANSWPQQAIRGRLGSLAMVLAAHAVLAAALVLAMHHVTRPVQSEVSVRMIDAPRPLDVKDPVPLPLVKAVAQINLPRIDIPVVAVMETQAPAVAAAPAPAPQTEMKPLAPDAPAPAASGDSAPLVDASAAGNAKPVYPRASKALGEQGVVVLEVLVTQEGTVGEIRVDRSSGYGRLDESALRAVRQWHFIPAQQGGRRVSMWYRQPITFDLKSA